MPHSIVNVETKNSLEPRFATRFSKLAGFFNLGNLLILKIPVQTISRYNSLIINTLRAKSLIINQLRFFLNTEFTENHRVTQRFFNPANLLPLFWRGRGERLKIVVQTEKICGHLFNLRYLRAKNKSFNQNNQINQWFRQEIVINFSKNNKRSCR